MTTSRGKLGAMPRDARATECLLLSLSRRPVLLARSLSRASVAETAFRLHANARRHPKTLARPAALVEHNQFVFVLQYVTHYLAVAMFSGQVDSVQLSWSPVPDSTSPLWADASIVQSVGRALGDPFRVSKDACDQLHRTAIVNELFIEHRSDDDIVPTPKWFPLDNCWWNK